VRPYRLFNGVHVDLDHVLAIEEPQHSTGRLDALDIVLVMAFRDAPIVATVEIWVHLRDYQPRLSRFVHTGEKSASQVLSNAGEYVDREEIGLRDTRLWHVVRDRYWQPIYDEWTRGKL
jgi:hypothetical protein